MKLTSNLKLFVYDGPKTQLGVVLITERIDVLKKRVTAYRDSLAVANTDCLAAGHVWRQFKNDAARHPSKQKKLVAIEHKSKTLNEGWFAEQLRYLNRHRSEFEANQEENRNEEDTSMEFCHRSTVTSNVDELKQPLDLREAWSPIDLRHLSCILVSDAPVQDISSVLNNWGRLRELQHCCTGNDALQTIQLRRHNLDSDHSTPEESTAFDLVVISITLPESDITASALVQQLRSQRYHGLIIVFVPGDYTESNPSTKPFQDAGALLVFQSQLSVEFLQNVLEIQYHIEDHRWWEDGSTTLTLVPKRWMIQVIRADICQGSRIDTNIPVVLESESICDLFVLLLGLAFARHFQTRSLPVQSSLVRRIASLYTAIGMDLVKKDPLMGGRRRDRFLFQLPFVLSEIVFAAFDWIFFKQCPRSFEDRFRLRLSNDISFLLSGTIHSDLSLEMIQNQLFPTPLREKLQRLYVKDVFNHNPHVIESEHNLAIYLDKLRAERRRIQNGVEHDLLSLSPRPLHVDWDNDEASLKAANHGRAVSVFPRQFRYNNARVSPAIQIRLQRLNPTLSRLTIQHRSWTRAECLSGGQRTIRRSFSVRFADEIRTAK